MMFVATITYYTEMMMPTLSQYYVLFRILQVMLIDIYKKYVLFFHSKYLAFRNTS